MRQDCGTLQQAWSTERIRGGYFLTAAGIVLYKRPGGLTMFVSHELALVKGGIS